jgi:hypothetical protein
LAGTKKHKLFSEDENVDVKLNECEHLSKCFNLASSFLKLGEDLQNEFNKRQISPDTLSAEGAVLCFLFAKNLTTAEAVLILCRERYPKDAMILVRTIFEAVLWVLDIFREPHRAEEKARAFIKYDPIDRRKKLKQVLELPQKDDNIKEQLISELKRAEGETIELEKELKGRKDLLKYGDTPVRELANNNGLLYLYLTFYWLSSHYAHNVIRSSLPFVQDSDKGVDFIAGPSEKGIDEVLIYLCHFLWYLINQFNSFLKLERDDIILLKQQELENIIGKALNPEMNGEQS